MADEQRLAELFEAAGLSDLIVARLQAMQLFTVDDLARYLETPRREGNFSRWSKLTDLPGVSAGQAEDIEQALAACALAPREDPDMATTKTRQTNAPEAMAAYQRGRKNGTQKGEQEKTEATEKGSSSVASVFSCSANFEEYKRLHLDQVLPSPTNPRKHFDAVALDELAASVKEFGVVEPIIVRPMPLIKVPPKLLTPKPHYELVAGERRLRASKLAGLSDIPARILELSDLQVLEIRLIENLQRADLDPLEEARGYQALLDEHGYTVDDLATKIGKSKAYVYGVLKLAVLPDDAAAALAAGRISRTTAGLIARAPNAPLRQRLSLEVLTGSQWYQEFGRFKGREIGDPPDKLKPEEQDEPLTFRQAKAWVEQAYMIELKQAPFDRNDAALTSAGDCRTCPKMTANNREDFPDARGDVCTDPACYRQKVEAHQARLVEQAKEKGRQGKKAKDALRTYQSGYEETKYCDKKLVKELADKVVLAQDDDGKLRELLPKAEVLKVQRQHLGLNGTRKPDPARAKQVHQEKVAAQLRRRLMQAVAEDAEAAAATWFNAPASDQLSQVVMTLADATWSDIFRVIAARRGWERGKRNGYHEGHSDTVAKQAKSMTKAQLVGLLAELAAGRQVNDLGRPYSNAKPDKEFFAAFGVDPAKVKKEVEAELAAKKKGKVKA